MFTNYCLYLKQEPPDRGIFEETFVDDKSVDGSESEFSEETSSQNDQIKSQNALSTARGPHKILKRLKSRRLVNGKVLRKARAALDADKANDYAERSLRSQWSDFEEVELDALTALFESILTGTVAVRNSQISEMIGRYSKLYNESKATNQELLVGMDSLLSCAGKSFNLTNSQTFYRSTQVHYVAAIAEDSGASDTEISPASVRTDSSRIVPNGNLPWCNGLFCNGYCNTAFCTGICLRLWEKKVQILRKRLLLKDILKKHNAGFKFKKPLAKDLAIKVFAAPSSHNVEGSNTNASEMVPSVVKHSKETSSQYHQRQSIHDPTLAGNSWNKKRTTDKKNSLKDCSLGPFVVSRRFAEIDRYYDEKQFIAKGGKRLYYARKGIASKSTFIIAQYYIRQQNRLKIMQRKKAIRTLKPILLRFIWLYRKIVFLDSIVYIQSVVRGFLVRNKIAELVEALIARKIRRLLATIRIRRFLRIFSSDIAVRWENKKAQQFRKRSITSLPISKNGNGEKRLTNRISFIHDDINDEAANAIFNKPVEATPGGKYEYVAPSASTTDINKCASINSSIVESSPKASVPINSGSPLRLGHKRAVSHDNAFMEKQNSIKAGKKESQLSKGYRDFLQFGTILRRPASYTKNKERVHAKNNSISAIVIPSMLGSNKLNITNEIAAQALNLEDKPVATASKPGLNTYSSKISADKHAISLQPPSKYAESELAESAKSNPCTTLSPIKEDSDHGRISEENVINDCHSLKLDTSIDMTWSLSEKVESAPAHYQVNNYNSTDSPPNTGDNSSSVSPNSKVTSPIPYVECDYDSSDGEENTVEDEKSFYKFRKVRQKIKANTGKVQSKRPSHARNISALTDPSSTSGASVASSTGSAQQVNEIYIRDLNVASVDTESNQNQVNSSAHSRVNSLKGLFASIPEDTSISPEVNGDNRKSLSYDLSDGSATVDKAIESEALDTPRIANSESLQPFLSVSIDSIDTVRRKRITPIARYAADHNYALSKIVSQPVSNSLSQRTSFSPMSTSRSASIDGVEDSAMTGAISARSLSTLESDNISKSFGDGISRARGNTSRLFNRKQAMAKKIASLKVSPVKDPTINDTSFSSAKDLFVERVVETVSPLKDVPQSSTVDDRFDDEDEEEDEDNMHDIAHNLTKAKGEPPLKYMNPEVLETFLPQQVV